MTLAPVPVTTNTLAVPTADILTFPLAAGIFTLLLPFANTPKILPPKKLFPPATKNEYEFERVGKLIVLLATGAPAMYIVAILV